MATAIIQYRAGDGTIYASEEQAERHDKLVRQVGEAMALLPPRPAALENNEGYLQHSAANVLRVSKLLLALAAPHLGQEWMDRQRQNGHDLSAIALGVKGCFGRLCDGEDTLPLQRAYTRLLCIDEQHREWQQPYFAINPDAKRVMVQLNP